MNTQVIELDLDKKGFSETCIRLAQGEQNGTSINAIIYDNGSAPDISLDGYKAFFVARLPDKVHYFKDQATISGKTLYYVCKEKQLTGVPGYTDEAYFELSNGIDTVQTERFALDILRDARDGCAPAQSWDNTIVDLEDRAKDVVSQAEAVVSSANKAASAANSAAASANSKASLADAAAESANANASLAANAAASANGAASRADAAANKAIEIANSVALGSSGSSETAALKQQVADLYGKLSDATGSFFYSDGSIYCPSSKTSAAGDKITFGASCTASGTALTLA